MWDVHAQVRVTLTNTGSIPGQEVVQLYVAYPTDEPVIPDSTELGGETVDFPVKSLRGFEKVDLAPGESKEVLLSLRRRDLSYWNVEHGNWAMPTHSNFTALVGTSSRNLPLTASF